MAMDVVAGPGCSKKGRHGLRATALTTHNPPSVLQPSRFGMCFALSLAIHKIFVNHKHFGLERWFTVDPPKPTFHMGECPFFAEALRINNLQHRPGMGVIHMPPQTRALGTYLQGPLPVICRFSLPGEHDLQASRHILHNLSFVFNLSRSFRTAEC